MMGLGLPMISAAIARLPNPEINLAAYGGIVQPIGQFFVSPMIMLLAASTALSKDWASYLKLRKFMLIGCSLLTFLHILVAFTPLYYWVTEKILAAPQEIIEPARLGLMLATPWNFVVGYRRFQQGVMIRFGHSKAVGIGTIIRLVTNLVILIGGVLLGSIPGVIVGISAHILGMANEAFYTGRRVRPILQYELKKVPPVKLITWKEFFKFYIPLVLTSMLTMIWQPIGTAAVSRMPNPLISLAVWPVINGATFIVRSFGMAYNEVVVSQMDRPGSFASLKRFTIILVTGTSIFFLLIAATPLSTFWFRDFSGLTENLISIAKRGYWLIFLLPALNVLISWYQGTLLNSKKTRAISESIFISLFVFIATLALGLQLNTIMGVYFGIIANVLATLSQTIWLRLRSRNIFKEAEVRDSELQIA